MIALCLMLLCFALGVGLAYWQGRDDGRRAERRFRSGVYRNLQWGDDRWK